MKKLVLLVSFIFIVSFLGANQSSSYGWEDGVETVLGFYGDNGNFTNSTEQAHSGTHSLKYWEDPLSGTPQAFIWWVTGLTDGDVITASFWVYDSNDLASYPKGRIWGHYTVLAGTIDDYGGSASGSSEYSEGPGWFQLSYTWTFASNSGANDGFVCEARIYSDANPGGNLIYIDDAAIDITSNTANIHTLPVELSSFTSVYANDVVTVEWATASETDVIGFNVFRGLDDEYSLSEKVNMSLIEGHGTTSQPNEYNFVDESADPYSTEYYYWLECVNFDGTNNVYGSIQYDPVDVDGDGQLNTVVHSFLNDLYPNPVQVGENITFNFMIGGLEGTLRPVSLNIYDIKGKLVKEVINEEMMVNDYTETWHVNDLANGVYFYQLKTENYQETKKLLIQ